MNKTLPYQRYDAQDAGPQYLEDLATGYWFSEVLFTAVEMDLFSIVGTEGVTAEDISGTLHADRQSVERFLHALCAMGLVVSNGSLYFNTKLSSDYLLRGRERYQGDSILWRKHLRPGWTSLAACVRKGGRIDYAGNDIHSERVDRIGKYIRAMDGIAKIKAPELVGFFGARSLQGDVLDIGAGSGAVAAAFLERFPAAKAVFLDLPEVLEQTRGFLLDRELESRSRYCPANILEPWPVTKGDFGLVILSNILHAYSGDELPHILRSAADCLGDHGVLLVHDFFREHCPEKAALTDLNMFINTYNGRVFSGTQVRQQLLHLGLSCTELVPLKTDTAVLFAARDRSTLDAFHLDPMDHLASRIRALGFKEVYRIPTKDIRIPAWTDLRCRYGCDKYGSPHCPPNSPLPEKTREIVQDYRHALLLEGEPPTEAFQRKVLEAERAAFTAGFHKAFSYWAGPCSLCESCVEEGPCRNTRNARPSMEGAGIDVFDTARRAGAALRTLASKDDFVKYFALILLE